jgi:hypothetical protein
MGACTIVRDHLLTDAVQIWQIYLDLAPAQVRLCREGGLLECNLTCPIP